MERFAGGKAFAERRTDPMRDADDPSDVPCETRRRMVDEAVDDLTKRAESLAGAVDTLCGRLKPVCSSPRPEPGSQPQNGVHEGHECQLAGILHELGSRLGMAEAQLRDALARLEV